MARETRGRVPQKTVPRPVQKIELSEKHIPLRLALTIVFALVGALAIGIGVSSIFGAEPGWQEVEVSSNVNNVGGDFVFLYYFEDTGSLSSEKRAVTSLYSSSAVLGYQLFTCDESFDDVNNMAYINAHPNEEIEVDEALYKAFEQIEASGWRGFYLGGILETYQSVFASSSDVEAEEYDPAYSGELADEFLKIAGFANDESTIDLQLLGSNRVKLYVSDEYLEWAGENAVTRFIDFGWTKNAFIADYLAEAFIEAGYTSGCFSSLDGFVRCIDSSDTSYSLPVYCKEDSTIYPAATLEYEGPLAAVMLRNYTLTESDQWRVYTYSDGTRATAYLSADDGLSHTAINDLTLYSYESTSCAELAMSAASVYIADELDEDAVSSLAHDGIYSVYCKDTVIYYYDDENAGFTNIYSDDELEFSLSVTILD